ncbi:MAG: DUF1566 domain-containing protein [Campylobacterota bacterium]
MYKIVLSLLVLTVTLTAAIFRQNSQDVVVDTTRSLMWQDNIEAVDVQKTHENALSYCDNLNFAGYTNWRLPKAQEYKSIVNKSNEKNYIDYAFKYNLPTGYWAHKAHWRTLWFYADYMNFISGTLYFDSRHKKKFVRCVRDMR